MRTVTDTVRTMILESDIELETLRLGELNLSAYADRIRPTVEEQTWKTVERGTIVVALSRIAKEVVSLGSLRPPIVIDDIKIQSPLCDITYEKTAHTIQSALTLQSQLTLGEKTIFVMTQGMSEITIVASARLGGEIKDHFKVQPKAEFDSLAGISVGFSPKYLGIPNAMYTLCSSIASKRINIIEMISTYTELMFVVKDQDKHSVIAVLERFFAK